jgi:hypothetical protein
MNCRCCKPLEPERVAKGLKYCCACTKGAAVRQRRRYDERVAAGVCHMCTGALEPGYRRCADCRSYLRDQQKALRERKKDADKPPMLERAEDWA